MARFQKRSFTLACTDIGNPADGLACSVESVFGLLVREEKDMVCLAKFSQLSGLCFCKDISQTKGGSERKGEGRR